MDVLYNDIVKPEDIQIDENLIVALDINRNTLKKKTSMKEKIRENVLHKIENNVYEIFTMKDKMVDTATLIEFDH